MANRRYATSAVDARSKVQLTGPLFSPDADKKLRQNIRKMLQAVADEGQRVASERSPRKTGDLADGIKGRVHSIGGRPWALSAVVSATHIYPWKNHGERGFAGSASAQYRGGKAEARYRMFRSTTYQLRSARAVLAANITEGLE